MNKIIVNTQQEYDDLPISFEKFTYIQIMAEEEIDVKSIPKNSQVTALGNSQVKAWDNSQVTVQGNSQVIAWDNSQVTALGNSQVTARDNSQVAARGNSQVTAWGNSQVTARDNSQVTARDNSQVTARDNSQVTAWGNSQVTAWDNSQVTARDNSIIIYFEDENVTINKKKTVKVIKTKQYSYTKKDFLEIYKENLQPDGRIMLFKSVTEDNTDFYTRKIKYSGIVKCPDWDSDRTIQCGNGLHLSPTLELALEYNKGKILKCLVEVKDFVVYGKDITKVRCKQVEVIED